jgi:hypothetical protein
MIITYRVRDYDPGRDYPDPAGQVVTPNTRDALVELTAIRRILGFTENENLMVRLMGAAVDIPGPVPDDATATLLFNQFMASLRSTFYAGTIVIPAGPIPIDLPMAPLTAPNGWLWRSELSGRTLIPTWSAVGDVTGFTDIAFGTTSLIRESPNPLEGLLTAVGPALSLFRGFVPLLPL